MSGRQAPPSLTAAHLTKYILMYILSNGENHYGTDIRSRKGASAGREMG
jgi:hypothetical protein